MAQRDGISPSVLVLLLLFAAAVALRAFDPVIRRRAIPPPTFYTRQAPPPPHAKRDPTRDQSAFTQPPARDVTPMYPEWFRDVSDFERCGYERDLSGGYPFRLNLREEEGVLLPLLSTKEILFLAWVSHRYQINPHFLLGIMDAESSGDCSAVSIAGAQGCFQITDSFGAQQLEAAYPQRMVDWHWAIRSLERPLHRPWPPEARRADYYPRDIFVPPDTWFWEVASAAPLPPSLARLTRRQLRSLIDPVATEIESPSLGPINVSSVANFSFGAIGSALYFHWQNSFLFAQTLIHDDLAAFVRTPGLKAIWMAAAYNQGFNRSLRQLVQSGEGFPDVLRDDVHAYALKVTRQCALLEGGTAVPDRPITWVIFLDFMQDLRWTYSAIPVNWDALFPAVKARHFGGGPIALEEVPRIFDDMAHLEPALRPEVPLFDYVGGYEGAGTGAAEE